MIKLDSTAPRFTPHATQRRIEMGLTSSEVLAVVEDPECVYPAHADRHIFTRGRLAVITDPDVHVIITILFHGKEGRADGLLPRQDPDVVGQAPE